MKNTHLFSLLLFGACAVSSQISTAASTVIFSEDFESYAAGSNLVGQGGWAAGTGGISEMTIKQGTYLSSQVLDGRDAAGTGWIMYAGHAVNNLSASDVTTLKVDAYATSSPASINTGIGLGNEPAPNGVDYGNSFVLAWTVNASTGTWGFDTRAIGGAIETVSAGIDEKVSLEIVVDGPAGEVYGVLEGASAGRIVTPRVAITQAVIEAMDAVAMHVDKSTIRTGASFDNLVLSSEPPLPRGVLFLEDFESYAPGSNLVGQNGWAGSGPGGISEMTIKQGTYLSSQVLDGRDTAGAGWIMYAGHAIENLSPGKVTTLQADAYATSSPASINSGIGLGNEPAPDGNNYPNSFVLAWTVNASTGAWNFDTRAIGGSIEIVSGGIDEEVILQIVVDGVASEAYGVVQSASLGRYETAHVAISAAVIADLDAIALQVDKSTIRTGASFDNLQLSAVAPVSFSAWAMQNALPAGQQAPLDDPNGDGVSNIIACFTGSDGKVVGHPYLPRIEKLPGGQFCIVVQRSKAIDNIRWLVETSTDGLEWIPAPPPVRIKDKGETEEITTDMLANYAAAQKAMARLRLELDEDPEQ